MTSVPLHSHSFRYHALNASLALCAHIKHPVCMSLCCTLCCMWCHCIYVFCHNRVVDTCAGVQGAIDPRPVTPATLFCAFSVSKIVTSAVLHRAIELSNGRFSYETKVADLWPEFGCNGKEGTTLRHVLTHATGLQHELPGTVIIPSYTDHRIHAIVCLIVSRLMESTSPKAPCKADTSAFITAVFSNACG